MSEGEQPTVYHPEPQSNVGKWILIALAIVYVGASAFFIYDQHAKLDKVTQAQAVSDKQIGDLTSACNPPKPIPETLAQQLGMTKKELRRAPPNYSARNKPHRHPQRHALRTGGGREKRCGRGFRRVEP